MAREFWVFIVFTLSVLLLFFIFVAVGWPGGDDRSNWDPCVTDTSDGNENSCYCEAIEPDQIGTPFHVQQPFNTWSNLYSVLLGGILAGLMYHYRKTQSSRDANRMRSDTVIPLIYLCVVVFLGLGSMFFHASMVAWGGKFDNLSMNTFACFLVAYTALRMTNRNWVFYLIYGFGVVFFSVLNIIGVDSLYTIMTIVAMYAVLEIIVVSAMPAVRNDLKSFGMFYFPALVAWGLAVLFWVLSQTGGDLCNPGSFFQWHGVWHWLAGAVAFFLYYFWRAAPR